MLSHTDLKKGVMIIIDNQPYEVLEATPQRYAQRKLMIQTKLKNLVTGNVISQTVHQGENFEEAEISKIKAKFLYTHPDRKSPISNGASQDKFFFCEEQNPANRFDLTKEQIGEVSKYLKPNTILDALVFQEKVINVLLPIKIQLKVTEAPPGVKGERAQAGTKTVTLETGAQINVPLFIEQDDIIELNTETGEYVKRME
jgi:elongation factor P